MFRALTISVPTWQALGLLLLLVSGPATSAELRLESSAVQVTLLKQVFTDGGKWHIGKPSRCNDPYFESPSVQVRQGRLRLRAHFAGRVGTEVLGQCISVGEPSWVTVSGRPNVTGTVLSLEDVRVDEVEKATLRSLLNELVPAAARRALRIDLQEQLRSALEPAKTVPYVADLSNFVVKLTAADQERLEFMLDFRLSVR